MSSIKLQSKIAALLKNFVDRPESYDSFSAKNCVLHAVWGIFLHSHTQPDQKQARYQKIPKTYFSHNITNLTKFDFPMPRDQISRSQILQMIRKNLSVGLSRLL
jgi:hypothetical protein